MYNTPMCPYCNHDHTSTEAPWWAEMEDKWILGFECEACGKPFDIQVEWHPDCTAWKPEGGE